MVTYFISDLHLSAERPETTKLFLKFLQQQAILADALYIMGDFFEAWIGEDIADSHDLTILNALQRYQQTTQKPFYFMPGNRDFLINERLIMKFGGIFLKDPTMIQLYGKPVLLMHGDSLCTDDKPYQYYRRFVQHPLIQKAFLLLPAFLRRRIANALRKKTFSKHKTRDKTPNYWDVSEKSVAKRVFDAFREYEGQKGQGQGEGGRREYDARILIHGHTHKPGIHNTLLNDIPVKRVVLGDWDRDATILAFSEKEMSLQVIS